jgi:hypothetical protein
LPYFERLALVMSLVVTGLGLSATLADPLWWLIPAPLTILAAVGAQWTLLGREAFALRSLNFVGWVPAAFLTLGTAIFLRQVESQGRWLILGVAILLLAVLLVGGYYRRDPHSPRFGVSYLVTNLITYLLAFGYFSGIYGTRVRSLQSATAITLVAFLLALALYSGGLRLPRRSWLAAGVSGLMLGEVTWGLNYWSIGGLAGGLVLLLIFYGLTGIVHNCLLGRLTRGLLLEFMAVTLGGFLVLAASFLWAG